MLLSEHPREFVPQTGLTVMKNTQFNAYFKEKMRMEWPLFRKTWSMNEESHRLLAFVPFSISKEVDDVIVFPRHRGTWYYLHVLTKENGATVK